MDERTLTIAENLSLAGVSAGIAKIRASMVPAMPVNFNGHCVDCKSTIPVARLATGAVTCVPCQVEREHIAATSKPYKVFRTP